LGGVEGVQVYVHAQADPNSQSAANALVAALNDEKNQRNFEEPERSGAPKQQTARQCRIETSKDRPLEPPDKATES
jgi:hypothetical protein